MQQFDMVIVGGAVTGSVLALALSSFSQHKMSIAIIEKSLPDYEKQGGFDARSIALAFGSLQKMRQITPLVGDNLGAEIEKIATPIKQIQVADKGHFGKATLKASEQHLPQLGAVVELAKLGKNWPLVLNSTPISSFFALTKSLRFNAQSKIAN